MKPIHNNQLIHETSPYLLQHAHNPVNWHAWNESSLEKAKIEDKPILISIGYSACHWCHVMERESFEDEETAAMMNEFFINIKIDREERPDLDHIYMDAVQAISGSGGWPLNVFLTPDRKPFYGGTYFPPKRAYNKISWKELLMAIHTMFRDKRNEIESQADNLVQHLIGANTFGTSDSEAGSMFTPETLREICTNILKNADKEWGGFGNAPKFPQTFSIRYLLRHYYFTENKPALDQALLSLDKMIGGGIYDQIGGGFARYSTDEKWLAPHFEKMLYDNALLLDVISEAYQLTQKEIYSTTIEETISFIQREMLSPEGAFYSALDADSEGVEGKYYTWQKTEIDQVLGEDSALFCKIYNVSEKGNWENTNILWLPESPENFLKTNEIDPSELYHKLKQCREKLRIARESRIRPALDDKILLGWNALMVIALCKSYAATSTDLYLQLAENNILFLEKNMRDHSGNWYHTWKNGQAHIPAFLDDLAYLIQAYIHLQEVTGKPDYLLKAKSLTEKVLAGFLDEDGVFFYYTSHDQQDVIVRKKEVYDGATPSGNGMMASNLFYLSVIFEHSDWKQQSDHMLLSLGKAIINYAGSFGVWSINFQDRIYGMREIVITGEHAPQYLKELNKQFIPCRVLQSSNSNGENFPLLKGRTGKNKTEIFLCRDYICLKPEETVAALLPLLKM